MEMDPDALWKGFTSVVKGAVQGTAAPRPVITTSTCDSTRGGEQLTQLISHTRHQLSVTKAYDVEKIQPPQLMLNTRFWFYFSKQKWKIVI